MAPATRIALRWLLYLAAGAVIAMALVVGALRLLLPLAPQFQDDIRAWAAQATGYDIRFGSITASWPLSGPELRFVDVSLGLPGEAQPVLAARELSTGLGLLRLVREGRATLGHVAVRGMRVTVERGADGGFLVQGRPLAELLPRRARDPRPELDLELYDVDVTWRDAARSPREVSLVLESLVASLDGEELVAEARLRPPEAFGRRLDVELQAPLPLPSPLALPPAWEARIAGEELDLARLAAFATGGAGPLRGARGDAAIQLAFADGRAQLATAEVDLTGVSLGTGDRGAAWERVSGGLEWRRSAAGWEARLRSLRVRRDGRDAPEMAGELRHEAATESTPERWRARAAFLRLGEIWPLARVALAGTELEAGLPRDVAGAWRAAEGEVQAGAVAPRRVCLRGDGAGGGVGSAWGDVAVRGLTGAVAADGDGGRLQLASGAVGVKLAQWFREELAADALRGLLVWRVTPEGVRFLSDDVTLESAAIDIRSRVALQLPAGAAPPVIDLTATAAATDARALLRYLPLKRFPPKVVGWLERAVVAGRVPAAEVEFRGPLNAFPYAAGEGVFRVALDLADGTLDYANGWPRVEGLQAEVVFDGVGMTSTRNSGRLGGLAVRDFTVRIPDLRKGVLAVSGAQRVGLEQIVEFVRATPVARAMGPTIDRVSGSGPVDAAIRLAIPIKEPAGYDLRVLFDPRGCRVALARLPLDLRNLRGRVRLQNTRFSADGLRATMLGEPVRIALRPDPAPDARFSHYADFTGATPVPRLTATFGLPLRQYFDGAVDWRATVRIPARRGSGPPLQVAVASDLRGLVSTLPAPVAKQAGVAWPATLELAFPEGDVIEVSGSAEPPLSWALRLASANGQWRVERGAIQAGPGTARLPSRRGIEIGGRVADLRLADWLDLGEDRAGGAGTLRELYRRVALRADRLTVAGQVFRDVDAVAQRGADAWEVEVKGPAAEGEVTVPFDAAGRPLALDMKRLWLLEQEEGADGAVTDPRSLMALEASVADAALGSRRLGRLELSVAKAPDGLVARRIEARAASFSISGTGDWRVEGGDPARQVTRLAATLEGKDIGATLEQLGFERVIVGEEVGVDADLEWPGGPSADFLARASGRIAVQMTDGQVLDLEPGGSGRLLGLLSVTALPRRLSLDFSDVLSKGLGFDSIRGNFRVGSGSAYTCNLGLTGPAADIGIVGRTGLATEDYDQVAVVRPQVSNVLTVGGVVLGGPVGGATMLLISQIFRKPLSTLGESYYRVSGSWDRPDVLRVQRSDVDATAFKDCEKEVTAALGPAEPAPATDAEDAAPP